MDYNEIGIIAFQEKRYEDAAKAFTEAIENNPDEAIGYVNFGNLLAAMNDSERAERFFQKAITVDEKTATAYYGLANLYYDAERYIEAAKLYQKAIEHGIQGADAYYMLAKSFERDEKVKLALPYMQRAAELAPNDLQIRLSYGILLCTLEMFDVAKDELEFVLVKNPKSADAHYNLGVLYAVSTEDTALAMEHLKEAYTIDSNFDQAKYIYDMISQRHN
ncbi:tetratricopeptide repeat protein [Ureibacillus chungkukjangi]|uniref:Tetratricopeptide repeat protein n=1 Tax=Ureibacillus chungkukjangi TaxID=1202712 RepID=A0A318TVZ2_9BACL|nr:tetratricopeptide repeat protein [Ureibacillus chungkukjangi]PYF08824.1 tetratricopeptide repeat protein [Ureibacillus chungkukjangi]